MANIFKYSHLQNLKWMVSLRPMSTVVNPENQSAFKRGTGGRSSFNGVVATVFGASGHLGRYVLVKLGKKGTQCIIPYRDDEYKIMRLKVCGDLGQILFSPFHLKDEDSLYKVMRYSNVVVNLIETNTTTSNFSFKDVHVEGARRIARIARECGVKHLVHLSALNASPNPEPVILSRGSEYNRTKWYGEMAVKEEFPNATIIRPAWFYGAEDKFLLYYLSLQRRFFNILYLWNGGRGIYKNPVLVNDVGQAIANAVLDSENTAGKTYQIFGPKRYELAEIVDYIHRLMYHPVTEGNTVRRMNMRYAYHYWLMVSIIEKICPKIPSVSWERLEMEHTTDIIRRDLPTMKDLGVTNPGIIEERFFFDLKDFRTWLHYEPEFGEIDFDEIPLPQSVRMY